MCRKDPSNDILVDADSKRFVDLLRDSKAAKARVASSPGAPTVGLIQQSLG
jgi:hypothetical protein